MPSFEQLIRNGGLIGLIAVGFVVFAESGLLIGLLLPGGDTTLLLAGSFAATGRIPLIPLIIVIVAAAILGDNVGYEIGRRSGKYVFKKKESFLFDPEHLLRAERFYERHGGKTIILARFVPIVRTFAPLVAGVGNMDRKRFLTFNVVGALIWGVGVTMAGYLLANLLGEHIEELEKYLILAVIVTTLAAFMPATIQFIRLKKAHNHRQREKQDPKLKQELKEAARTIEKNVSQ